MLPGFLCDWALRRKVFSEMNGCWRRGRSKKQHIFPPEMGAQGWLRARRERGRDPPQSPGQEPEFHPLLAICSFTRNDPVTPSHNQGLLPPDALHDWDFPLPWRYPEKQARHWRLGFRTPDFPFWFCY